MAFKAKESLSEQIAMHLANDIIVGDLLAGDRIQELRIAGELEVSRGSVREALLILERWHLIDILPRRGAVVKDMSEEHVNSLYEIIFMMYSHVAGKAVGRLTGDNIEPFFEQIQILQSCVQQREVEAFYTASFDFLDLTYSFAANSFIEEVLDNLQPAIRRSFYMALHLDRDEMQHSLSFFKALIECLLQEDMAAVAEVIGEFVVRQRDLVLDSISRARQIEEAWSQRHRR